MLSKETLEKVIRAFDKNDVDAVVDSFAENGEWVMVGHETISGRSAVKAFFEKHNGVEMISSSKSHMVIDGNTAVVDGEARCREGNGTVTDMWYCDVYDFEGEKIRSLKSYCVVKK